MTELALGMAVVAITLAALVVWQGLGAAAERSELVAALRDAQAGQAELARDIMARLGYSGTEDTEPSPEGVSEDDEIDRARRETAERVDAELELMAQRLR